MRVAHFVQRYPPALGGSEAYFARLSRYLVANGDSVTVFTSNALALEAFWSLTASCLPAGDSVEQGVHVRRYPLWRFPGRRWVLKPLSLIPHRTWQCLTMPCNPICWRMWGDASRPMERFDVVHATAFPYAWPITCGLRLARRLGVPFVVTPFLHLGDPHDPADPVRRAYTTPALLHLLRSADRVLVQTLSEGAELLSRGIPEQKLVLQGLGVEPRECTGGDRKAARRRWNVGDEDVVIGHLANNSAEKGTIDLLEAAQRLWRGGQRLHVVLAGPEMPNFRRFWNSFKPLGPVVRLGVLDESAKRDLFAGIDVFALPSRSDSFGLVLLEAWANGKPNVAYRAGGVADLIRDGEDGSLVRCGDIDALTNAIAHLIVSAELRQRLGESGLERTGREFRWEDKLALVRNVCAELSGRPRLAATPAQVSVSDTDRGSATP
jgi:glycosyltransferase involved in cell wall biosynthesis